MISVLETPGRSNMESNFYYKYITTIKEIIEWENQSLSGVSYTTLEARHIEYLSHYFSVPSQFKQRKTQRPSLVKAKHLCPRQSITTVLP